jgi:hypothetical protein
MSSSEEGGGRGLPCDEELVYVLPPDVLPSSEEEEEGTLGGVKWPEHGEGS